MNSEPSKPQTNGSSPSFRLDRVSVLLVLVTLALVGWTAWLRFGPASRPQPPAVGQALPPLRLVDLETAQPRVLFGAKGKVSWVVFWSAGSPSGRAGLVQVEGVWKRLKAHRRFTMLTAAVNSDQPDRVRAALSEIHAVVPAYLAGPETLRRFGAELADPPLHLLVDGDGRIAALVRGAGQDTINRLAAQVQRWLEEIDPLGNTWFARTDSSGVPRRSDRKSSFCTWDFAGGGSLIANVGRQQGSTHIRLARSMPTTRQGRPGSTVVAEPAIAAP